MLTDLGAEGAGHGVEKRDMGSRQVDFFLIQKDSSVGGKISFKTLSAPGLTSVKWPMQESQELVQPLPQPLMLVTLPLALLKQIYCYTCPLQAQLCFSTHWSVIVSKYVLGATPN